jgi:hypothetical protein
MSQLWGPSVWTMLHVLTIKCSDELFTETKQFIITILKLLPCAICRKEVSQKIKTIIQTKTRKELILVIFNLHNIVNKKMKNIQQSYNILNTYNDLILGNVYNKYYINMRKNISVFDIIDVALFNEFIMKFKKWLLYNSTVLQNTI